MIHISFMLTLFLLLMFLLAGLLVFIFTGP